MRELLIAELRFRSGRALTAASGVALGVALFLSLSALGDGFREAARRPLESLGADLLLTRPAGPTQSSAAFQTTRGPRFPFGLSTFGLEEVDTVKRIEGVGSAAGALLLWDFGPETYQTVLGVDAGQTSIGPGRVGTSVVAGRFLDGNESGSAVVDKHYAAFYSIKPGDSVRIGGKPFVAVGIIEVNEGVQAAAANFYISLKDAQLLGGVGPRIINQVFVRVARASALDSIIQRMRGELGEISAITEQSIIQVMGGIARISDRFSRVASFIALIGGVILTGMAFAASVTERRREIGISKAVGWTMAQVTLYFLVEGLAVSILGALAGLLLGWLLTFGMGLVPIDFSFLAAAAPSNLSFRPHDPVSITLPARLSLISIVVAFSASIVGGVLASWITARRAAALKPADTLRD